MRPLLLCASLLMSCAVNPPAAVEEQDEVSDEEEVAARYSVGGTVSGLTGTGLVLVNGGSDPLEIQANGAFAFSSSVARHGSYVVTVRDQPKDQRCAVANGASTVAEANVTNILVTCEADMFTIGGEVAGLSGTLVLRNNDTDELTRTSDGAFTFATPILRGATFAVSIAVQPLHQHCDLSGASGEVSGSVTDVAIVCVTTHYTVSAAVTGLAGSGLVLQNAGESLAITANGAVTFANVLSVDTGYALTIVTQPTSPVQVCSITQPSGEYGGANVTVQVACHSYHSVSGVVTGFGEHGLPLTLMLNGADDTVIPTAGPHTFTFATPVLGGQPFAVTTSGICFPENGKGVMPDADVTNVVVSCGSRLNENFDRVTSPALPSTVSLSDCTEGGAEWVTTTTLVNSAPNAAWIFASPTLTSDCSLKTLPIMIRSDHAKMEFRHRYTLEEQWDGGVLEVSIDGAPFVDIEDASAAGPSAFTAGGYVLTMKPGTPAMYPLANRKAWTGSQASYTTVRLGFGPNFEGHTVVVRWRRANDNSGAPTLPGWWIDNVLLFDP